jgi:hypothetical protein
MVALSKYGHLTFNIYFATTLLHMYMYIWRIIACEDELNAILNTGCVNQDGTFNINLSIPPPQSHGMFVVRPPSPAVLSQQGIPLGLPQIPCQPSII